jgi:hypothetical protein
MCTRPQFYARVGVHIEVDAVSNPGARLLAQAAQAIARDCNGKGPDSWAVVMQRLRRWMVEGKVTQEHIDVAVDTIDAAEDDGLPDPDLVLGELVPVLRRRAEHSAMLELIDAHGKRRDTRLITEKLQQAERLGESAVDSPGVQLGTGSFAAIEELKRLVRLPLGVPEIDALLEGGLWRKGLGTVIADTGGGKSMYLTHQGSASTAAGLFVAYATLELPEAIVLARMKANIVNVPVNAILNGSQEAKDKLAAIEHSLGLCVVKSFTPKLTTVGDLIRWIAELEQEHGRAVDLMCVDYADKLGAGKDVGTYEAGERIYEGLRVFGFEHDKWIWTASQSKGRDTKKKKLDTSDVADSMHKVRAADMVLTATTRDDGEQIYWYKAKDRLGRAHIGIGPLPHEFEYGRVAPAVALEEWDDLDSW